jgi:nicotinamidase-related amidase
MKTKTKILIIVDMQNDFLSWQPVMHRKALITNFTKFIPKFMYESTNNGIVITQDTHAEKDYKSYFESKKYPLHCERGTIGWDINDEIKDACLQKYSSRVLCMEKNTYGGIDINAIRDFIKRISSHGEDESLEFIVVGLCSSICVLATMIVLNTNFPKAKISNILHLTGSTNSSSATAATTVMMDMGFNLYADIYYNPFVPYKSSVLHNLKEKQSNVELIKRIIDKMEKAKNN